MRILQAKNIFESSKFCFFVNKFCGFLFFTVSKDATGNYLHKTSALDLCIFFLSLIFNVWTLYSTAANPPFFKTGSVILNIGGWFNARLVMFQPVILVLLNFYNRKQIFLLLKTFFLIDQKVN